MENITNAEEMKLIEMLNPSADIANSAFYLASDRCNDLEIPPIFTWILLKKLCDQNLRADLGKFLETQEEPSSVDHMLGRLEEELFAQLKLQKRSMP